MALQSSPEVVGGMSPADPLRARQLLAAISAALDGMKPELAEVFRLRMNTQHSFKEIAEQQQVSVNTALGRMHCATKYVAAALRAADLYPED